MAASSFARGSMILRWRASWKCSSAASLRPASSPRVPKRPQCLTAASTSGPALPPRFSMFSGRRVLSTMIPFHAAVASARLVTSLSLEGGAMLLEGRFANYVSPI